MSSNKKSTKNTNTDNNDNTGLVSVADVTVFRDDCHNKEDVFPVLFGVNAIKPDEKNVKYSSTAVYISNIS